MSTVPTADPSGAAEAGRVILTVALSVPTKALDKAAPSWEESTLADAALHLADEVPNSALGLLLGSAIQAAAESRAEHVALAMGAIVHLLQSIRLSRAAGVTP